MRRGRTAALLAAVAVLLAGCGGVPTSGPIEQGPVIGAPGADQVIGVIVRPPREGMTPEELVRGFQEATASSEADYRVAREYLTAAASQTWEPGSGVQITGSNGLAFTTKDTVVNAAGGLSGTIDAAGQYAVAAPGATLAVAYGVTKVAGEWRISSLPPGLVLSPGDIDRSYRTFNLYFFTGDFVALVPDPVTVGVADSGLPTQLVRDLLSGATSWLAPAVRTAFPEGTELALDSVPVVDGIAEVALTEQVLTADDRTRQALSAQLVWTLRQLPDITAVRMTVNGQNVPVPGAGPVQQIDSWSTYDPDVLPDAATGYAVDARGLVSVDLDGVLAPAATTKPSLVLPGVSMDSTRVAGLSADRSTLWEARLAEGQTATRRYVGSTLSRPSFDRLGSLWFVDQSRGLIRLRDGTAVPVPVAGLPKGVRDQDLLAAAVSRDGVRIALLVRRGQRVEPWVAVVENSADAVRVSSPRRVESVVTEAADLAWQDAGTLLILGRSGASSLEVVTVGVGSSQVRRASAPEGAATIAAGPGRATLAGTSTTLFRNSAGTWAQIGAGVDPVYPG